MRKENIKIGDLYELGGELVMVTNIINGDVYISSVAIDEQGNHTAIERTENCLTDFEVKHLK
jgi:hypothetical protein